MNESDEGRGQTAEASVKAQSAALRDSVGRVALILLVILTMCGSLVGLGSRAAAWTAPILVAQCAPDSTHFGWQITLHDESNQRMELSWDTTTWSAMDFLTSGTHTFTTARGGKTLWVRYASDHGATASATASAQQCAAPVAAPTPTTAPTPTPTIAPATATLTPVVNERPEATPMPGSIGATGSTGTTGGQGGTSSVTVTTIVSPTPGQQGFVNAPTTSNGSNTSGSTGNTTNTANSGNSRASGSGGNAGLVGGASQQGFSNLPSTATSDEKWPLPAGVGAILMAFGAFLLRRSGRQTR